MGAEAPDAGTPAVGHRDLVYSNRLIISYFQYADGRIGREATDRALHGIGSDRHRLSDASGYHSAEESVAITKALMAALGEPDLSYLMGRNLPYAIGIVGGFIAGITSPAICMKTLGQMEGRLARKTVNRTVQTGRNRFQVDITFREGFREDPVICRNRIGCYESLPLFFGQPYAVVEHPQCLHRGADHCVYHILWPEDRMKPLMRIFQLSVPAAAALGLHGLLSGGLNGSLLASLAAASAGFLCLAVYRHYAAKQSLEWSLLTNEGLTSQNRLLERAHLQMTSLQELSTSLTRSNRTPDICAKVVSDMVEELGFGASQIWLLDPAGGTLACRDAKGYPPDLLGRLASASIPLDGDGGEHRDIARIVREGRALVENDPAGAGRSDGALPGYARGTGASSYIVTPILQEDRPLGALSAERHDGLAIGIHEKLLVQSIANIAANALIKADLFEGMERKIEQRTRDLESAGRQLLAAKEMAIQSEKLSALGQMAAGIAHEINNPLNFLVNVMPDLRRDMECLERIRALALDSAGDPSLRERVRELEAPYDLGSHLLEKDFVFDNIRLALEKSTHIAGSLKVFSRNSSHEKLAWEPFAGMVRSVFDIIPQKHRGDTVVEVDIPESAGWTVNRNKMEQAVLTLVKNALEAMEHAGRLRITGWSRPGEAGLSFRDDGPGIPPGNLTRIFEPFFTTKPPGKGTGLGLTIAAEIVKRYGGTLAVDSAPGAGATFTMLFRAPA